MMDSSKTEQKKEVTESMLAQDLEEDKQPCKKEKEGSSGLTKYLIAGGMVALAASLLFKHYR